MVLTSTDDVYSADVDAPLADAAESGEYSTIRQLLDNGADLNAAQVDGMTALHWATYDDDQPMATLLVRRGADVNTENRYGVPPLSLVCTNGNAQIVQLLLNAGANPNAKLRGGETVLMTAARTGRLEPVQALIAAGADVNTREREDQTALMWAAADGHAEVVQALIDAGADFLTPLSSGFTPLLFAIREGQAEAVRVLLAAGADVNAEMKPQSGGRDERTTPLILAVENGHFALATELLKAGADPNAAPAGFTALHAITWVRRPLGGDTDPAPIGSGSLNSLDLVSRLLEAGADINARYHLKGAGKGGWYSGGNAQFTKAGSTAFVLAARNSDLNLMRTLLDAGADWQIPNGDNCTALLAAAGVGALGSGDELPGTEDEAIETVRLLLDLGANINAVSDQGETAMHGAAYQERPLLVKFLVDNGAEISVWNRENKFGWTPLMIARGHRPGNFRPSPKTIEAIEAAMQAADVQIPPEMKPKEDEVQTP
ncbi:MAG: ankyrin repeat domain-containing protein [Planctomycetaceae bacterium]|nr:ankyrin repeat domain-containing protein [Planctomycetaceae bacterium]